MKKLICIILMLITTLSFITGCNKSLSFGNYNFKKVHVSMFGGEYCCVEIASWHDNEIGCEVKLKDGTSLYLSEGTYMLIEDKCPICK